jgi:acetyl-CoA acetyltransferase
MGPPSRQSEQPELQCWLPCALMATSRGLQLAIVPRGGRASEVRSDPPRRSASPDPLQVQAAVGAKNAVAFDITAACSGFVLALITAVQYIKGGSVKKVLVVGADALSRFVDWRDRSERLI